MAKTNKAAKVGEKTNKAARIGEKANKAARIEEKTNTASKNNKAQSICNQIQMDLSRLLLKVNNPTIIFLKNEFKVKSKNCQNCEVKS